VKTLAASLQHFYNSEGQWKLGLVAVAEIRPRPVPRPDPRVGWQQGFSLKTLAASLHHSTRFIARFIPLPPAYTILHGLLRISFPCHQPTPFYTVYCRMIYLDLSVQFKKVHDFLSFSHWKLRVFPRFSHGFFSPRQERTRLMYTGVYRNQRIKRCFGTVKSVFIGCYTASIYRISTATKL
jgi:hypothetical protein